MFLINQVGQFEKLMISGFVDFKHKRDAKEAVKDLNGEKLKGSRVRLEMSDGPGNRKSGTSYEETSSFSTSREERGFNPRVSRRCSPQIHSRNLSV